MGLNKSVFQVALAAVVGLVGLVGSEVDSEASGYRYLCMSSPGACEYAPPDAPTLNADVCYDGTSVTLMGASGCASGQMPFYVDTGEVVDPQTGLVQPYIALPDACTLGYCLPAVPNNPPGEAGPMCCDPSNGACTDTGGICPPDKVAVWCDDGETPQQSNNGEWECHEN